MFAAAIFAGLTTSAFSQTPRPAPTASPRTQLPPRPESPVRDSPQEPPRQPAFIGGETTEKSINVDPGVNLNICIRQGTVTVNGWKRNEVRVFVSDGTKFTFKVQSTSPKSGEADLVRVEPLSEKNKYVAPGSCIWGEEIEVDVPVNATININGTETTTSIDSVKRVMVKTVGGDVTLRNITGGITAYANQGDITVEESSGAMTLDTTTGNILAFEVGPAEIGDLFKARTNSGSVAMQALEYRQIEVNSTSGSISYTGNVRSGGLYSLFTNRGSIRLALAPDTSCQVNATFRSGSFNSELPYKIVTENVREGSVKNVVANIGSGGDASLKLTTINGSINIKKQ